MAQVIYMKWQDILKNVIAQNRVKEIEDINIDIDDDDCIRWVKKLYGILEREPTAHRGRMDDLNEEEACKIKEEWEDKNGIRYLNLENKSFRVGEAINVSQNFPKEATVSLQLLYYKVDDTYEFTLYCSLRRSGKFATASKILYVEVNKLSHEKAIRKTKELCNYLNLSYDKLTEGVF